MTNRPLNKINAPAAIEVCSRFDLSPEARLLLREGMGSSEFLEALITNQEYLTGVDFIAQALSPREAIWWGCLCLQYVYGDNLSALDKAACHAAVRWVLQPTDESRAAAKAPAEAAGQSSPAGMLAAAANQTGDNLPLPKAATAPPKPFTPAKAVSSAVKLLTSKVDPIKIVETQRLFVELGIGVAEGRFTPPSTVERPGHAQGPTARAGRPARR